MAEGTLLWQPILGSKLAKSDYSPLFVALAFRNEPQNRHSDFRKFVCDDLATLCVNLINFSPVTPEFTKVIDVHPSFLSLKQTFQTSYLKIHRTDFHQIFTMW